MSSLMNLSPQQLREAADLQESIASLQSRLNALLGGKSQPAGKKVEKAATGSSRKRGKISAAGLERIRAAQRARWAKFRASK